MRGPIEYIVDEYTDRPNGNTFAEELAQSGISEAAAMERVAKLQVAMGSILTTFGVVLLRENTSVELEAPDNFFVRETIESAIAAGFNVPGGVMTGVGAIFIAENLNFWRRARNRRKELEKEKVV